MKESLISLEQFADMLICEEKNLPTGKIEMDLEMKMIGKSTPEQIAQYEKEKEEFNSKRIIKKYVHRKIGKEYLIPPGSSTNVDSILSDLATLTAHQINLCAKELGFRKIYLRSCYFKEYIEAKYLWACAQGFVRLAFPIDNDEDEKELNEKIDSYFHGLYPSIMGFLDECE